MSVAKIKKVHILAHKENKVNLLEDLQKLGVIEIEQSETKTDAEDLKNKIKDLQQTISQLDSLIAYLENFQEKKGFLDSFLSGKLLFNSRQAQKLIEQNHYAEFISRLSSKKNKIDENKNKIENNETLINTLFKWQNISIDFSNLNLQDTILVLGTIDIEKYDFLKTELTAISPFISLKEVNQDEQFVYFSLISLKEFGKDINQKLKFYNVIEYNYTALNGVIRDKLQSLINENKMLHKEIDSIKKEIKNELKHLPEMQFFYDYLTSQLNRLQIQTFSSNTEQSFMFHGWIPEKDIPKLKNIETKYSTIYTTFEEPSEDDESPTLMENKKSFRPFELVTKLYSVPKYFEIDPTPYLAPFFAVTFALCLTDAGYGLFLLIVSLIALKKLKSDQNKPFLILFTILGFLTFSLGLLAGSFFGIDFSKFSGSLAFLHEWHDKIAIIDPLKKPMLFFGLALGLGWIQLTFGFIIKFVVSLKEKNYQETMATFPWILIMLGIGVLSINGLFTKLPILWTTGYGLLSLGGIWLFIVSGAGSKNIFIRFAKGLYGLYNVMGLLGDILSYSRILALGLATAVIAGVANTLGGMVLGTVSFQHITIGFILILLLKIVGFLAVTLGFHFLNLAINTLGAFIHSVRLQFVEFFMKFYEGGGREFKPFKKENKYTIIKE